MTKLVSREKAEALIREQIVDTITQDAPKESSFLGLARKLPNMTSKQTRIPVLDMLPMAYWVNGDTGYKQTSQQAWDNVYLTAAELAVIVPIPEAVLDDASYDLIGEITPRVKEAIGLRVDAATMFGVNRPDEWTNDIITRARQAGNNVSVGSSPDYYDLLLGDGGVFSRIEQFGYGASGVVASMGMRAKLRGIKGTDGHPIFSQSMQGVSQYSLDGTAMQFPANGAFDTSIAQMIVGDWKQAVYSIRQDITVKILDQGVIQDPSSKEIIYNLAQQDMIALRVVFRMGWAMPNPATRLDEGRLSCPFAYLEPLVPATAQAVTFTVKDNAGSPTAVADATVDVNGSRKKTSAQGKATFNLFAGSYPVKIKKDGYAPISETVVVASAAVSKDVVLTPQG